MKEDEGRGRSVCLIVGLILALVLIAPPLLWVLGAFGEFNLVLGEDGVRMERTTATERQAAVVAAMRTFTAAQQAFKRRFGSYATSTEALVGYDGVDASAALSTWPPMLFQGYYFTSPDKYGAGRINRYKGYVIIAEPETYVAGTPTFAIGPKGVALQKDMGGKRVTNIAQVDGSWKPMP